MPVDKFKSYQNLAGKIPGVNFINVQQAAFGGADPKRVKKTENLIVFFALSGSGLNFTNIFTYEFYTCSSQKRKNSVKLSVSFYAFGIYWRKSCS